MSIISDGSVRNHIHYLSILDNDNNDYYMITTLTALLHIMS